MEIKQSRIQQYSNTDYFSLFQIYQQTNEITIRMIWPDKSEKLAVSTINSKLNHYNYTSFNMIEND